MRALQLEVCTHLNVEITPHTNFVCNNIQRMLLMINDYTRIFPAINDGGINGHALNLDKLLDSMNTSP